MGLWGMQVAVQVEPPHHEDSKGEDVHSCTPCCIGAKQLRCHVGDSACWEGRRCAS